MPHCNGGPAAAGLRRLAARRQNTGWSRKAHTHTTVAKLQQLDEALPTIRVAAHHAAARRVYEAAAHERWGR
eukprot:7324510-Prymnesium_polylepis.1